MDLSNFWWQSGAGATPAGIGNSLRFRGAQYLTRAGLTNSTTCTVSWWQKTANVGKTNCSLGTSTAGTNAPGILVFAPEVIGTTAQVGIYPTHASTANYTAGSYRDPSAWYHFVYVSNAATNTTKLYINGVEVLSVNPSTPAGGGSWTIGNTANPAATVYRLDGYLSEIHTVDGTALDPTSFGEFNADGVWVPKKVDLSVPQAPAGPNAWSSGWDANAIRPLNSFDGVADTTAVSAANHYTKWTNPNGAGSLSGTKVRLYVSFGATAGQMAGANNLIKINGTDITHFAGAAGINLGWGWIDVSTAVTGAINTIELTEIPTVANPQISAIELDGVIIRDAKTAQAAYGQNGFYLAFDDVTQIGKDSSGNNNHFTPTGFELTDTTSTNYDWMKDSPTDNYGTLNPLDRFLNSPAPSAANLNWPQSTSSWLGIRASEGITSGKYYWEYHTAVGSGANYISAQATGLANSDARLQQYNNEPNIWVYINTGQITRNGVTSSNASWGGQPQGTGDVVGIAFDADAGNLWFAKNGTWLGLASPNPATGVDPAVTGLTDGPYFPHHVQYNTTSVSNFGNRPFKHTPPAGFKPLSTAGLPDVPIKNPSDHFTTILDSGANILTKAQAKFPNGLWWIKDRANSNQHQFVDSVRGGNLALQCPAVGTDTAYAAPAGNSVAWCWSAPTSFTNAAGANGATIASSGRVNTDAGFSICTWTGTNNIEQVFHGLSKTPEFIILKNRSAGQDWQAGHKDITWQQRLNLGTADGAVTEFGAWGNQAPTAALFTIGTVRASALNQNYVGYLWHSVPGYSAFGSYVGNGNPDGPFIYTGHRVGWLLVKDITGSEDWTIVDCRRSTYNPADRWLRTNLALNPEFQNNEIIVDLLSNGFKVRCADNKGNGSGKTYIWASFAEHPFGGGNVSPAPAR